MCCITTISVNLTNVIFDFHVACNTIHVTLDIQTQPYCYMLHDTCFMLHVTHSIQLAHKGLQIFW